MNMDEQRFRDLTGRFPKMRILVVGDLMLDRYLYGTVDRISPEAPVPVVRAVSEKTMPGGGANVAANLRSLGAQVDVAGGVGTDAAGGDLVASLRAGRIGTRFIRRDPDVPTIVKWRIIAERQQVVRVDWEGPSSVMRKYPAGWLRTLTQSVTGYDGVIFADYGKGGVERPLLESLLAAAHRRGIPTALDPKDNHCLRIRGMTLATPNCKEAHVCAGLPARTRIPGNPLTDRALKRAAETLRRLWSPDLLLITLGAQGVYLSPRRGCAEVIPTRAREVYDVSGAGDTMIATTLLALAAGATHREAAWMGNCAAGVVVGKIGTASCSRDELEAAVRTAWAEE